MAKFKEGAACVGSPTVAVQQLLRQAKRHGQTPCNDARKLKKFGAKGATSCHKLDSRGTAAEKSGAVTR